MSLLAGPIAEKNNSVLNEITGILECIKNVCNQHFAKGSDSFRIYDYIIKNDQLMLWAGNEATTDIINNCQELLDDFVDRFKKRNCLNSNEIEEMFCYWDSLTSWSKEEKLNILKTKFEEMRGISPF